METNDKRDSINIMDISKVVSHFFKSLYIKLGLSKQLIIGSLIFSILVGILSYLFWPKYYSMELVIENRRVPNEICMEILNDIQKNTAKSIFSSRRSPFPFLEHNLKFSPKIANSIKSISYLHYNKNYELLFRDSIGKVYPFKIEIDLYDTSHISEVEWGIINYLETLPYIEKRKISAINNIKENSILIDKLLQEIDTINLKSVQIQRTKEDGISIIPFDPTKIIEKKENLYSSRINNTEKLFFINSFELINRGAISPAKKNVPLFLIIVSCWIISFSVSFTILKFKK